MDVAHFVDSLRAAGVSRVTLVLHRDPPPRTAAEAPPVVASTLLPTSPEIEAERSAAHAEALERASRVIAAQREADTWAATGLVPLDAEQLMSATDRDRELAESEARVNSPAALEAATKAAL